MSRNPHAPEADKQSRRKARAAKLAASLRENLLRRKAQARSRKAGGAKAGGAADTATTQPSVDLEAEGVVPDTEATNAVIGDDT